MDAAIAQQLLVLEAAARWREHCAGILLQALVAALQAAGNRKGSASKKKSHTQSTRGCELAGWWDITPSAMSPPPHTHCRAVALTSNSPPT